MKVWMLGDYYIRLDMVTYVVNYPHNYRNPQNQECLVYMVGVPDCIQLDGRQAVSFMSAFKKWAKTLDTE